MYYLNLLSSCHQAALRGQNEEKKTNPELFLPSSFTKKSKNLNYYITQPNKYDNPATETGKSEVQPPEEVNSYKLTTI